MRAASAEPRCWQAVPALLVGSRLAGAGIGILTQILLARTIPAEALGLFFLATSLATVLAVMAAAGYPSAVVRFTTRYRAFARLPAAAAFVRFGLRDAAVAAIAVAVVMALAGLAFAGADTGIAMTLVAIAVPFLACGQVLGAAANSERRFLLASLPDLLLKPAGMLATIGVALALGLRPGVPALLAAFVALGAGAALIQALALGRSCILSGPRIEVSRRRARAWRHAAIPLVTQSLFTMLLADVAIVVASLFVARGELAVLAICLKISFLIGFAIQATHQTVLPGIAEHLHRGRVASAAVRLEEANRITVAVSLAALLLVAAFGERVLAVFAPAFASAHWVLTILVAGQLVRAVAGPAAQLLTVLGCQRFVLGMCPVALASLVAANAVLVPAYGLTGAALSIVAAIATWSASLGYALRRSTGLRSYCAPSIQRRSAVSTP